MHNYVSNLGLDHSMLKKGAFIDTVDRSTRKQHEGYFSFLAFFPVYFVFGFTLNFLKRKETTSKI